MTFPPDPNQPHPGSYRRPPNTPPVDRLDKQSLTDLIEQWTADVWANMSEDDLRTWIAMGRTPGRW